MLFNNAVKNAMLDGIDATFNSGQIRAWTGSSPGPANAATGTKIAQGELPADLFSAAASAAKAITAALTVTGLAAAGAGTALGYFRILQDADDDTTSETQPRIEGTIGSEAAGINITAAVLEGGQAKFTTESVHGLSDGDIVRIAGHNAAYNRKFRVHSVTSTTFKVNKASAVNGANGTARKSYHLVVDNVSIADTQVLTISSLTLDIP